MIAVAARASGFGTKTAKVLLSGGMRRAKRKLSQKIAIAAAAGAAGEVSEKALEAAAKSDADIGGGKVSNDRWSFIGEFIDDRTMENIALVVWRFNPISLAVQAGAAVTGAIRQTAEMGASVFSRRVARGFRRSRKSFQNRIDRLTGFKTTKRSRYYARRTLDLGVAAAETFGTWGAGVVGKVGQTVVSKVAIAGMRATAKKKTRQALRRSVGRQTARLARAAG